MDSVIGRLIAGKYRIEARLGAGGMGAVFRAKQFHGDQDLGPVVVKLLLGECAQDAELRARFVKEARAARELRSPHVVKVFDFGEDQDGTPYLVMELLEGKSLFSVLLEAGRLPVRRSLRIAMQVAEAMVECHERGILHRDLKPDNLLLLHARAGDFVKIVDFGIARVPTGQPTQSTVSSLVIGTPRYMAPEQLMGQPIDARIDIFSLGVILFEMVCGASPIPLRDGDHEMAYVSLNLTEPPRKVSDLLPGVPPELDALVDRMLAKRPEDRPASMAEVVTALEQLLRLPQLGEERAGLQERRQRSMVHLFLPQASRTSPAGRAVGVLRRRYVVPALLGVLVGLIGLLLWLLSIMRFAVSVRLEAPLRDGAERVPGADTAALAGRASDAQTSLVNGGNGRRPAAHSCGSGGTRAALDHRPGAALGAAGRCL